MDYRFRVEPDFILSIFVSAQNPASVVPFNQPLNSVFEPGQAQVKQNQTVQTYTVDQQGYINFPVLGKVKVAGLTKNECANLLETLISRYVDNPIVNVSFLNSRYSVIGEVNKPGVYAPRSETVTILDAITDAGDLTLFGQRNNILLIREVNGKREFHRYDLTDANLFASPYYYLKHNDVIYVEPNEYKKRNSKYSQADSYNMSVISTVISSVSVITSILITLFVK